MNYNWEKALYMLLQGRMKVPGGQVLSFHQLNYSAETSELGFDPNTMAIGNFPSNYVEEILASASS